MCQSEITLMVEVTFITWIYVQHMYGCIYVYIDVYMYLM